MAGQERAEHFLMEADDESAKDSLNMKQSEKKGIHDGKKTHLIRNWR